jgi:hypothetical protein
MNWSKGYEKKDRMYVSFIIHYNIAPMARIRK